MSHVLATSAYQKRNANIYCDGSASVNYIGNSIGEKRMCYQQIARGVEQIGWKEADNINMTAI